MISIPNWRAALAAVCVLPGAAALAADAPQRQLGAHQHGHGKLGMVVEGNKLQIELEVPGMDIVGFEHEASTPEQKAVVDAARAKLLNISSLLKLPDAAGCRQTGGEIDMAHHDDHDDDHGKDGPSAKAGDKKDADGDHDHAGHSEVHAEYALECATPAALTSLSFDYFKAFEGARELDVEVVTAKGASKFEVTREKPDLDLAGLM